MSFFFCHVIFLGLTILSESAFFIPPFRVFLCFLDNVQSFQLYLAGRIDKIISTSSPEEEVLIIMIFKTSRGSMHLCWFYLYMLNDLKGLCKLSLLYCIFYIKRDSLFVNLLCTLDLNFHLNNYISRPTFIFLHLSGVLYIF